MLTAVLFTITSAGTNAKTLGLLNGVRNTAILYKKFLMNTIKFLGLRNFVPFLWSKDIK